MSDAIDEMKLTAYALGELEASEAAAIEKALASGAQDQRLVDQVRAEAQLLTEELAREEQNGLHAIHYAAIEMMLRRPQPRRPSRREVVRARIGLALSLAASIAIVCAAMGGFLDLLYRHAPLLSNAAGPQWPNGSAIARPAALADGAPGGVAFASSAGGFVRVSDHATSSFPLQTDSTSYDEVRRALLGDKLPLPQSVRIAELVNAFEYDDSPPIGAAVFAGHVEVGPCPWQASHRLARIGIKACPGSGTVARDVKAEVAFNPAAAQSYRLIGYEDASAQTTQSSETISASHAVTALYEVEPARSIPPRASSPTSGLLTVRLHYREPSPAATEQVVQFASSERIDSAPSRDFTFTAAVAEFGMVLKKSPETGHASFASVLELAQSSRGPDPHGQRQQFIDLVRRARELVG